MSERELREKLADYAHNAWSGWMRYQFERCERLEDGRVAFHPESLKRWVRQMNTAYVDLPESEKESDRAEADRILAIIEPPKEKGEGE